MCGIAGYIYLDGQAMLPEKDVPILEAMGRAMEYRGPDDTRHTLWENVGFIFKRLSIVDLAAGQQPFEVDNGRVCAMVNGEIYNHREIRGALGADRLLQSQSDCEVIPNLYLERGKDLFTPVNGMFATAILDRAQRRVLLGRDRIGIKPLFYCVTPDRKALVFASELKALFAHPAVPRQFDWNAAMSLEIAKDTRGREIPSFFRGIQRLPAGHLLDLSLTSGDFTIENYWHKPARDEYHPDQSVEDYIAGYRELLDDSVRARLMTDVDLGVFLSGGVDSAAVAALAARYQQVPTFSVSSKSTAGSGDVEASVRVARHLGLVNHQVFFDHSETSISPDQWREVLWACEFPLASAEQLYKYYLHAFAKQHYPNLKVMLLGQGVDEFTGGYMEWTIGERLAWEPSHWPKLSAKMKQLETLRASMEAGYLLEYHNLVESQVVNQDFICQAVERSLERNTLDLYQGYYRQNLDTHLWHEDRTSSAHSIESRVPFLDHRLLEYIARIPAEHHPDLFMDKKILRRAVADLLPRSIAERPKGYFYFGKEQHRTFQLMYAVLTGNDRELIDQAIAGSVASGGPINPERFHDYVTDVARDGQFSDIPRLLKLVNMGLLADMASKLEFDGNLRRPAPLRELSSAELDQLVQKVGSSMPTDPKFIDQMVPKFCSGVELVRNPDTGSLELLIEGRGSSPIASPNWETFLKSMDGQLSVGEIVATCKLPKNRIIRQLRESMKEGIITAEGL